MSPALADLVSLVLLVLVPDVGPHHRLIQADCGHLVARQLLEDLSRWRRSAPKICFFLRFAMNTT